MAAYTVFAIGPSAAAQCHLASMVATVAGTPVKNEPAFEVESEEREAAMVISGDDEDLH